MTDVELEIFKKEKAKQTETLLIYANFVKTSNQVDKKINKLINMLK